MLRSRVKSPSTRQQCPALVAFAYIRICIVARSHTAPTLRKRSKSSRTLECLPSQHHRARFVRGAQCPTGVCCGRSPRLICASATIEHDLGHRSHSLPRSTGRRMPKLALVAGQLPCSGRPPVSTSLPLLTRREPSSLPRSSTLPTAAGNPWGAREPHGVRSSHHAPTWLRFLRWQLPVSNLDNISVDIG